MRLRREMLIPCTAFVLLAGFFAVGCGGQATTSDSRPRTPASTAQRPGGEAARPATADAKQDALAAARQASALNLQELALAMLNCAGSNNDEMLPATVYGKDGKPLLSWRVAILPYIGDTVKLYQQFKLDEPWDSEHNKKLLNKMPKVFAPVTGGTKEKYLTHYQVLVGGGAAFENKKKALFPRSFPDGTSNTILIVEAAEAVPWTKPADLHYDPKKPLPKFGGLFDDGFHAAFADSSVYFINRNVDEKDLRAAITRAGAEEVDLKKFKPARVYETPPRSTPPPPGKSPPPKP